MQWSPGRLPKPSRWAPGKYEEDEPAIPAVPIAAPSSHTVVCVQPRQGWYWSSRCVSRKAQALPAQGMGEGAYAPKASLPRCVTDETLALGAGRAAQGLGADAVSLSHTRREDPEMGGPCPTSGRGGV